jgi:hypothetical protein
MSELSTVLIQDGRYNDITDRVTIGVKDGLASVIYQSTIPTLTLAPQIYLMLTSLQKILL